MEIALHSFCSYNVIEHYEPLFDLFKIINDNILIDRLYKRYVKRIQNTETLKILEAKLEVTSHPLLIKLVEKFKDEIDHAEYFYKEFGEYIPIRLVINDIPYSVIEEEVSLEDYDNLEGDPLWMRPEYMLEKYQLKNGVFVHNIKWTQPEILNENKKVL